MIRPLSKTEEIYIRFLSEHSYQKMGNLEMLSVYVVDEEYGSIRSSDLKKGDKVFSVAECQFTDTDGVPVVIILLLDDLDQFGELVFWKGDGSEIIKTPKNEAQLHSFKLTT